MLMATDYLQLIGIEQWALRKPTAYMLTGALVNPTAQWLFILEKEEIQLDSPLLNAILAALNQTLDTIAIAYYETQPGVCALPDLSNLRYIVAMGAIPVELLQASKEAYCKDITFITSHNLTTLAHDMTAKRALWQQLKSHRI